MKNLLGTYQPTLNSGEIEAIVEGRYQDSFAVFGLHTNTRGKGLIARMFFPGANSIALFNRANHRKVITLKKIHTAGLFEATMVNRKHAFDYYYRAITSDAEIHLEDSYRFASQLTAEDIYLFAQGCHEQAYNFLGARGITVAGIEGVLFVVWAPSAQSVAVVGNFNCWDGRRHLMRKHPASGVFEIFIAKVVQGDEYKYEIVSEQGETLPLRADPYARAMQHPPETASRVCLDNVFAWGDSEWLARRAEQTHLDSPVAIYEVHAGSWRRKSDREGGYLSYLELADELIPYVLDLGFTHIQLMPISEYPFDGSWGYQPVGLFAPSSRFGTPAEFKQFIDCCHQHNIGVLLDWVPGHFPTDAHGLGCFDGSCLYEHADIRKGFHRDWQTLIYNYGRNEVQSFLLSNANYWLDEFHVDGLRVDAVASMLYLDYSREEGEWVANERGGREHLEAISLLQMVNSRVYKNHPGIMMIAEESTAWEGVSAPVDSGGLGFGFKWNMGWMNDSLGYMSKDPIHRKHHHHEMSFSTVYAWHENFILPISHDEVVHGKSSLLHKMPGDDWQKFANLRAYLGFMWGHPGKKLLFMGCEFAQRDEWNHDQSLDWHLLQYQPHIGVQSLVRDLNHAYRTLPALHHLDADANGFVWLQLHNNEHSVFAWLRKGNKPEETLVVIANMTPQVHHNYQLGVADSGVYRECINTDAEKYGGSGQTNGDLHSYVNDWDGQQHCISITLAPLATLIFRQVG